MLQKLGRTYPLQFELVALFLLALTIYQAAVGYSSLPERIPTHFDMRGLPDQWGSRSEILIYPLLGAGLYALLTAINILMAVAKDPRKFINLPAHRKQALSDSQVEALRIFLNRSLLGMKILLEGLVTYSVYMTVEVAENRASGLADFWFFIPLALLALAVYMALKTFRMTAPSGPV